MDYTIIGNEVNLAAWLESHAEVGGILLAHETHALVKDMVLAAGSVGRCPTTLNRFGRFIGPAACPELGVKML